MSSIVKRVFDKSSSPSLVWALVCILALGYILYTGGSISVGGYPYSTHGARLSHPARPASPAEIAYFMFDYPPNPETFIFELADPVKIEEARDILAGRERSRHILGTIVKQPAWYNSPWSYHLNPASASFFDNAIEICDASIQYVEDNLDSVCGSFLPGCGWCPWNSRLLSEVFPQTTPEPTATHTPATTPTTTPLPGPGGNFLYLPFLHH